MITLSADLTPFNCRRLKPEALQSASDNRSSDTWPALAYEGFAGLFPDTRGLSLTGASAFGPASSFVGGNPAQKFVSKHFRFREEVIFYWVCIWSRNGTWECTSSTGLTSHQQLIQHQLRLVHANNEWPDC